MSPRKKRPLADVVSLEQFREKVAPKTPITQEAQAKPVSPYKVVDYLTYGAVKRVIELIKGGPLAPADNKRLSVVYKINGEPSSVTFTKDLKFAIDANQDELSTITSGLAESEAEKGIEDSLTRLYCSALVARHSIPKRGNLKTRVNRSVVNIGNPFIGPEEVQLTEQGWTDTTRLRAAAGLGLTAVTEGKPGLRKKLTTHLSDVLEDHHSYTLGLIEMAQILNSSSTRLPEEEVDQFLLGFCNPLSTFEAKQVVKVSMPSR